MSHGNVFRTLGSKLTALLNGNTSYTNYGTGSGIWGGGINGTPPSVSLPFTYTQTPKSMNTLYNNVNTYYININTAIQSLSESNFLNRPINAQLINMLNDTYISAQNVIASVNNNDITDLTAVNNEYVATVSTLNNTPVYTTPNGFYTYNGKTYTNGTYAAFEYANACTIRANNAILSSNIANLLGQKVSINTLLSQLRTAIDAFPAIMQRYRIIADQNAAIQRANEGIPASLSKQRTTSYLNAYFLAPAPSSYGILYQDQMIKEKVQEVATATDILNSFPLNRRIKRSY